MEKIIKDRDEATAFVESLCIDEKYIVDVQELKDNAGFLVRWQEHKTYTAYDGKVYPDEIWLTEDDRTRTLQKYSAYDYQT